MPSKEISQERGLQPVRVKVWGPFACFTRPEMKVERVTYDVMTPSAARGILDAILWKPEMRWHIQRIIVLKPIKHISWVRNELKKTIATRTVRRWMSGKEPVQVVIADEGRHRAQRHTLALRDVAYIIEAYPVLTPKGAASGNNLAKYVAQFQRRVEKGKCHTRPYLGCREFAAEFAPPDGTEQPIDYSDDLGLMLFDMHYTNKGADPVFFHARLENGILEVPQHLYEEAGL